MPLRERNIIMVGYILFSIKVEGSFVVSLRERILEYLITLFQVEVEGSFCGIFGTNNHCTLYLRLSGRKFVKILISKIRRVKKISTCCLGAGRM